MIKLENRCITGWEPAVRGMRNPMNSWDKSDSDFGYNDWGDYHLCIGPNDLGLMKRLCKAGPSHRKFMRFISVYADITAPLYWWSEFDIYKVGTNADSCSKMHTLADRELTLDDFSCERLFKESKNDDDNDMKIGVKAFVTVSSLELLDMTITLINSFRCKYNATGNKDYWEQMIQLLPNSYNQKRTVMLNYEVLSKMYHERKNHKLIEWHQFCDWIKGLPYSELITGEYDDDFSHGGKY